jgi:dipeptidase D
MRKGGSFRQTCVTILLSLLMTVSAGSLCQSHAVSVMDESMKPFAQCLDRVQPSAVARDFQQILQVPRPSHHEERMTAFLADFGKSLGLETITDDVGNVIIRMPATRGYEHLRGVILQAHMDMVPQKTPDKAHNFLKDPIVAYVKDGWLTADRTTLGADDGIGVALIMAILQDRSAAHGPLEALFTVNEEDGFTGAKGLRPGVLKGDFLINVDSEEEGVFFIGSAGGLYVDATARYPREMMPAGMNTYQISVKGLRGGHSGGDIDKGRGSASKLLVRLLWSADKYGVRIAAIEGGDRYNAIPREAVALVAVPAKKSDEFQAYVSAFEKAVKSELASAEPGLSISIEQGEKPARVMNLKAQARMLAAIHGSVDGVLRMSDTMPGLVETSDSMGIFKVGEGTWTAGWYVRSSLDSARDDTGDKIASVMKLAGAEVKTHDPFSGWPPDPDSPLLKLMKDVYRANSGKDPRVEAIHAGLETSVFRVTYPRLDMISVGPNLEGVHSPDEKLELSSISRVYQLLTGTLPRIPAK